METRAPFIVVGAFVLAAIGAVFGFVYWLHNTAGTGARTVHHVQFEGSVLGTTGRRSGAVQWNPRWRGHQSGFGRGQPAAGRCDHRRRVRLLRCTADTKVGLDFQGLTGVPVITLEGGKEVGASTDMTDARRRSGGRSKHDAGCAQCTRAGRFSAG